MIHRPMGRKAGRAMHRSAHTSESGVLVLPHAKLRVLVVEDDPVTARALRRLLEEEGFASRAAGSYRDALRTAAEWVPDVLVCDIGLPGKDGLEVMKSMRQAYPHLHGIVGSGHTDEQHKQRSREAGFSSYVTTPFTAQEVTTAIHKIIVN